jgi:hypothetical protein
LFGNGNINDISYNNNETSLGKEETTIISVIGNGIQTPSEKIDEVIGVWPRRKYKMSLHAMLKTFTNIMFVVFVACTKLACNMATAY